GTRFALAPQTELHSVIDAGRHFDFERDRFDLPSRSHALRAFLTNDLPRPVASGTGRLHAEKALRLHDLPGTTAVVTGLRRRPPPGTAAVAGLAQLPAVEFDGAGATFGGLGQIDRQRSSDVRTTSHTAAAAAPATAEHS